MSEENNPNYRKNFVRYYQDLTPRFKPVEILLFGKIKSLAEKRGFSYQSETNMAYDLGLDPKTAYKAIDHLLSEGLVEDVTDKYLETYKKIKIKKKKRKRKPSPFSKQIKLYATNLERYDEILREIEKDEIEYEEMDEEEDNDDNQA